MVKIITHSGGFHCDDVFAVATIALALDKNKQEYEIIRTREPEIISTGDYVVDVGGQYDPAKNRFDHHQEGGAGARDNGVPYAAFGLVWKTFGKDLSGNEETFSRIDRKLATPIDAVDNGELLYIPKTEGAFEYSISDFICSFLPTWKENDISPNDVFIKILPIAKELLQREIKKSNDKLEAEQIVTDAYQNAPDKRIIELDKHYPWKEALTKFPEPLFVITPREDGKYQIYAVPDGNPKLMKQRKNLPESWAGLQSEELSKITGINDAVFCHNNRFIAVAGTLDGIRQMAKLALAN